MRILLTLDYELFFGRNSGSIGSCLLMPSQKILEILDRYNVKATFFVDAGFVECLKRESAHYPELEKEYFTLREHISFLAKAGHDIQLHIHPHWEDSKYSENGWNIDTKRYRLHDFPKEEVHKIVKEYKKVLEDIIGDTVFVFRAGGWCIQPFDYLIDALVSNGITIDSTVFSEGYYSSDTHSFDFRGAEDKTIWKFHNNPIQENKSGTIIELPISSLKTSPLFFWKLALAKKFGGDHHLPFGDGVSVKSGRSSIIRMLTNWTTTVASMDGFKSSLLKKALSKYKSK